MAASAPGQRTMASAQIVDAWIVGFAVIAFGVIAYLIIYWFTHRR